MTALHDSRSMDSSRHVELQELLPTSVPQSMPLDAREEAQHDQKDEIPEQRSSSISHGAQQITRLTRTVTAQDWTGPDDSVNPRNWPFLNKVFHTIAPAYLAFVV